MSVWEAVDTWADSADLNAFECIFLTCWMDLKALKPNHGGGADRGATGEDEYLEDAMHGQQTQQSHQVADEHAQEVSTEQRLSPCQAMVENPWACRSQQGVWLPLSSAP
ncbi:hypothetical protein E2C01_016110 [Portunus trituberculatus]|uniref:Uncharacterized protein n=1 Tax=Portunus trituberculatus TaxID=210409 RepID=A0A5B7DN74_PORTR|nr:hypothetical protein [Portunus trituberculatus]